MRRNDLMQVSAELAKTFNEQRMKMGMSITAIAFNAGVARAAASRAEKEGNYVNVVALRQLCFFYNVTPPYALRLEPNGSVIPWPPGSTVVPPLDQDPSWLDLKNKERGNAVFKTEQPTCFGKDSEHDEETDRCGGCGYFVECAAVVLPLRKAENEKLRKGKEELPVEDTLSKGLAVYLVWFNTKALNASVHSPAVDLAWVKTNAQRNVQFALEATALEYLEACKSGKGVAVIEANLSALHTCLRYLCREGYDALRVE